MISDTKWIQKHLSNKEMKMTWLETSRFLTVFGSAAITIGLYDQVRKALTTKSVNDLSTILVLSLIVNETVWFNYGYSLSEWPIMLISGLNLPAVIMIAFAFLKFRVNSDMRRANG